MRSSSRRSACRSPYRGLVEEAHEIVTGTTRAHQLTQDLPGNTDHADIVHLPDTRGAGLSVSRGWIWISTAQDRFATVTHDPHVSLLTGDAETAGGTR